jgi:hypothetical protein
MLDVSDELAALVRAARREPELDGSGRQRIWSALEQRLAYGPAAPTFEGSPLAAPAPAQKLVLLPAP